MFDALFSVSELRDVDAERMHQFGVSGVLVPLSSLRVVAYDGEELPSSAAAWARAEAMASVFEAAGIRPRFMDGVSPDEEPERSWDARWHELVSRLSSGQLVAIGELRLGEGSARALRILDRHLELSAALGVPVLVRRSRTLDAYWRRALEERAIDYARWWWWTRVAAEEIASLTSSGAGVIATVGSRGHSPDAIVRAIGSLDDVRPRVAISSARGRGLNPFALASIEVAAARVRDDARKSGAAIDNPAWLAHVLKASGLRW